MSRKFFYHVVAFVMANHGIADNVGFSMLLQFVQSRVIRVLNLWQKNNVFPMEIIQPLLDMVSDPNETNNVLAGTLHTAFLITLCYLSVCDVLLIFRKITVQCFVDRILFRNNNILKDCLFR